MNTGRQVCTPQWKMCFGKRVEFCFRSNWKFVAKHQHNYVRQSVVRWHTSTQYLHRLYVYLFYHRILVHT